MSSNIVLRFRPPRDVIASRVHRDGRWHCLDVTEWEPTPEGAALLLMRRAKGVTLRRAAEAAGVSAYDWSRLERGRVEPVDPTLWITLRAAIVTAERHDREGGAP